MTVIMINDWDYVYTFVFSDTFRLFLSQHPDVVTPPVEIHFFNTDSLYYQGLNWYRNRMPPSNESQITVEKTPKYFVDPKSAYRIVGMNMTIRLILILCDPVRRVVSDYRHEKEFIPWDTPEKHFSLEELILHPDGRIKADYEPIRVNFVAGAWLGWMLCTKTFYIFNIVHDDVIKWKHFPRYWPFVRGSHRSPVNSPHKGQWRGAVMFLWSTPE